MNALLKACVDEAFDLAHAGEAALAKDYPTAITNVIKACEEVPAIVADAPDAKAELEALMKDPAADADLLAYVAGKAVGADAGKLEKIVASAADLALNGVLPLIQKGQALVAAIKA